MDFQTVQTRSALDFNGFQWVFDGLQAVSSGFKLFDLASPGLQLPQGVSDAVHLSQLFHGSRVVEQPRNMALYGVFEPFSIVFEPFSP